MIVEKKLDGCSSNYQANELDYDSIIQHGKVILSFLANQSQKMFYRLKPERRMTNEKNNF